MNVFGLYRFFRIPGLLMGLVGLCHAQFGNVIPDPPTFSPKGKNFTGTLNVTVSCSNRSYYVYYSTDGSNIDSFSKYRLSSVSLSLSTTTTVKAACAAYGIGVLGNTASDVITEKYVQTAVGIPEADPGEGYYNGTVSVKLTVEAGATLHYTTNGTTPTANSTTPPSSGLVSISPPQTLKAIATRSGYANSPILTVVYSKKETVATPTCNCKDTTFSQAFSVKLGTTTTGASIYYTLDGSDPQTKTNFYSVPIVIPLATTKLSAYAVKENMNDSKIFEAILTYLPKAPTPFSEPGASAFIDTQSVKLKTTDSTVEIHYTTNGQTPTLASPLYSKPILLDSTTLLSAKGFTPTGTSKYAPSDLYQETFTLQLSPPSADKYVNKGYYHFSDSIPITLKSNNPKAQIIYTLNGVDPVAGTSPQLPKDKPVVVLSKDTTVLKVRATTTDKKIQSLVATWSYIKDPTPKLPAPQAFPPGQSFRESIQVRIIDTASNANIFYTTNGKEPDSISSTRILSSGLITLNKSTTLKMRAFRGKSDSSEISTEDYFLQPEPPTASLSGGSVKQGTKIALSCLTDGSTIYYSLDSSQWNLENAIVYSPNDSITINKPLRLQAIALLGSGSERQISPFITYQFDLLPVDEGLKVTQSTQIVEPYQFAIPGKNYPDVYLEILPEIPTIPFLTLQHPFKLTPLTPDAEVQVLVNPTQNMGYRLYEIIDGKAKLFASQFPATISQAGIFSLGIDAQPPQIHLLSHTVNADDSTEVRVEITDNILNPFYQFQTSISNGFTAPIQIKNSIDTLTLKIKNANGIVTDLWFRIRAGDYSQTTTFPPDSAFPFILPQAFKQLATTQNLDLGNSKYKWDLIGFPISPLTPVSTNRITEDNPGYQFKAERWGEVFSKFDPLTGESPMNPGQGYWLAADKPLNHISLTRVRTATSDTDGVFRIQLHKGWNLIANPSLATLWWPVSRKSPDYSSFNIRGLIGFDNEKDDYFSVDSMLPFKGYFVHSKVPDTLIDLRRKPVNLALAKQSVWSLANSWSLTLTEMRDSHPQLPVMLAGIVDAKDGVSIEDEPALSSPGTLKQGLRAIRNGRPLISDFISFTQTDIRVFSIAYGNPGDGQPIPEIQVETLNLPSEMQAWAWLPERKLKQQLIVGSQLNAWTSSSDSLKILVGPKQNLETWAQLQSANDIPEKWGAKMFATHAKMSIQTNLPSFGQLKIELVQANGKRKVLLPLQTLGAGFHQWEFPNEPNHVLIRILGHSLKNGEIWSQTF